MNSKTKTNRNTVGEIARLTPCSQYHVRRFADSGQLESVKDYNGWRIFPNADQTIKTLRKLLALNAETEDFEFSSELKPNPNKTR